MGDFDSNLQNRVKVIEDALGKLPGCPSHQGIEHIHKGLKDARVPTKVSLIEFRSNNDREVAIRMLLNSHEKDLTGANIDFKRARTALQRQRNDNLVKAEALMKKAAKDTDQVKIKTRVKNQY